MIEKYAILNELCDAYNIIKMVGPEPIELIMPDKGEHSRKSCRIKRFSVSSKVMNKNYY